MRTPELAQPDLDAAGDHGVGEVVEAQAGGHVEGEPADHEGHKHQQRLVEPAVALLLQSPMSYIQGVGPGA